MPPLPPHRARIHAVFTEALAASGQRLAITGATGWLGATLAYMAIKAGLTPENGRLRLFGSVERTATVHGGRSVRIERLEGAEPLREDDWTIAHFAGLGKEKTEGVTPDRFLADSDLIMDQALTLANGVRRPKMIFTSSGAVYGPTGLVGHADENPYGYAKRIHEHRVIEWCAERGGALVLPRVFNVGGPFGNKIERYALSSIVRALLQGQPVTLASARPVFRSYVHVEELMAVLFNLLARADSSGATPFDTCGREIVELGVLAEMAGNILLGNEYSAQRSYDPELDPDWYVGNPRRYQTALEACGLSSVPLSLIIADTATDMSAHAKP